MKQHYTRAIALLLSLVMVLSAMPVLSFATEEGEGAALINGLPGDQTYGVLFHIDGYVVGADITGSAPAKAVQTSADGSTITSLPNGAAIFKFVQNSDGTYYLMVGNRYMAIAVVDAKSKIVLQNTVEGAKWDLTEDSDGTYTVSSHDVDSTFKYLEYYRNSFSAYKIASDKGPYRFKFFSTSPDEDGRVGELIAAGPLPTDGGKYVIYNHSAKVVMGQPTGADAPAPVCCPHLPVPVDDAIAYEDVGDGGLIFTVHVSGTTANPVFAFESNGKYLAMPENTVDENGKTNNAETLHLIDWPQDTEKQHYAQWTLVERTGGYEMKNKAAKFGQYYCSIEYFNDLFSGWTYKADSVELFAMKFYPMEDKDGQGYVVNPTVLIDTPDPAIGEDCPVSFTLNDAGEVASVSAQYQVDSQAAVTVEPEMKGKTGSFTVSASALEGGSTLKITVSASNTVPKAYSGKLEAEIRDEPLILTASPAANSATGDEKRPEISVTFSNVKENPTFIMLVDEVEVPAAVSGDKLAYTPAQNMADGKHSVSVTITRADGKSVTKTWSFFVGAGGETLYFGQIHAHTAEYSDGAGTLEDAYEHAHGVDDMDFLIVTDHSNYFDTTATATTSSYYDLSSLLQNAAKTTTKWEEARATAKEYNELYDDFLCLYGYEMTWSGGPGHTNSFNTYGTISRNHTDLNNKTGYSGMHLYNDMMVNAELGLAIDGTEAKTTRGGAEVTGVNATKYIPFDE